MSGNIDYINWEDKILSIYLRIIKKGSNPKIRKTGFCFMIGGVVVAGIQYTVSSKIIEKTDNSWIFEIVTPLIIFICGTFIAILFSQKEKQIKYKNIGIKLDKQTLFCLQKEAHKKYKEWVFKTLEEQLIEKNILSGTEDDLKLLDIYIHSTRERIRHLLEKPKIIQLHISMVITFIIFAFSLFVYFQDLGLDIHSALGFSLMFLLLFLLLYNLLCQILTAIDTYKNKHEYSWIMIIKYLESILLKRLYHKIEKEKEEREMKNRENNSLLIRVVNLFFK